MLRFLGLQPQAKKVFFEGGFTTDPTMLGIEFHLDPNTNNGHMWCSVPHDKVVKTRMAIDRVLDKLWATAEDTQSLLGLLVFVGRVMLAGKWHLPCTVRASAVATTSGVARVHGEWRTELTWWVELLCNWNRVSILVPKVLTTFDQEPWDTPYTDASRSKQRGKGGAGAVFKQYYQYFDFSTQEVDLMDIMELEGLVVVLWLAWICEAHPNCMKGKRFLARCDNDPFVCAVNSRKSNYPVVAFLLGEIHQLQCRFSFDFRLKYIASKLNVSADALSRNAPHVYFDHMSAAFNLHPSDLVRVPVQNKRRRSFFSRIRSIKRSTASTQTPPKSGKPAPPSSGCTFANGSGHPSVSTRKTSSAHLPKP